MVYVQCRPLSQEVTDPWQPGIPYWSLRFMKRLLSLQITSLCMASTIEDEDEELSSASSPPSAPQPSSSSLSGVHGQMGLSNLPKFDEILSVSSPKRMPKTKRLFYDRFPHISTYQRPILPKAPTIIVSPETAVLPPRPQSSLASFTESWHQPQSSSTGSTRTSSGSEGTLSIEAFEKSSIVSSQSTEDSITDFDEIVDLLSDTATREEIRLLSGVSSDLSTNESTLLNSELLSDGPRFSPTSSYDNLYCDSGFGVSNTSLTPLVGLISLSSGLPIPDIPPDMSTPSTMVPNRRLLTSLPQTLESSSSSSSSNTGSPVLDSTSDEVVKMFVYEEDQGVMKAAASSEQSMSVLPLLKAELKAKIQLRRCISGEFEEDTEAAEFKEPETKMTFEELKKRERKKAQNRKAALKSRLRQNEMEENIIKKHRRAENLTKTLEHQRQLLSGERLDMIATLERHLCTECRLKSREKDKEIIRQIQKRKSLYDTESKM